MWLSEQRNCTGPGGSFVETGYRAAVPFVSSPCLKQYFMKPGKLLLLLFPLFLLCSQAVAQREQAFAGQHLTKKDRSEEHTSELQSPCNLVCRLLLDKKK